MHAYETRVSHAFRGMEGGADSTKDMNPPEAAEQVEVLCGVNEQVVEGAIAPLQGAPTPPSLSEAQLAAFWAGIVANRAAAKRTAARFVSKDSVEDVVHSAAVRLVENAQRSNAPEPFPATPDRFRRKFLKTVRNYALKCISDSKRPACPVHSHWGIDPEPSVGGHKLPDRELDTLFARNDHGKYDAPAPTVRRAEDDLNGLHYILRNHIEDLSQTEREIIEETYFQGASRHEIAARRGISLNTYDNHKKAACRKLRESLMAIVDGFSDLDLPQWYDRAGEMNERHSARQRRRAACKKENRSNFEGDGSNFEGDASNSRRDA